jgi:3-deoxy-manno-octulosonate cytidylyltransferase (CMP-KDO synthetase)
MNNAQRVVAIIPARFSSTRLPGKPLADIAGKPMIRHVYERASQAKMLDWCLVATDDERVAAAVREFGGHAVITPGDLQTGTDRVAFVTRSLPDADIIVNIQGDEPLLEPAMIDEAVRTLIADDSAGVGTLVRRIEREDDLTNSSIVKTVLDASGSCLYFSRSPIPFARDAVNGSWTAHHRFYKHIGLYVYRRDFLLRLSEMDRTPLELAESLEQLRILEHGYRIKAGVTTPDSIPVDTPDDLERVRDLMASVYERQ